MSPIYFSNLARGNQRLRHDPYRSEAFSLGLVVLEAGLLTRKLNECLPDPGLLRSIQAIYNRATGLVDVNILDSFLHEFHNRYSRENPSLSEALRRLLAIEEEKRLDLVGFNQYFAVTKDLSLMSIPSIQPQQHLVSRDPPFEVKKPNQVESVVETAAPKAAVNPQPASYSAAPTLSQAQYHHHSGQYQTISQAYPQQHSQQVASQSAAPQQSSYQTTATHSQQGYASSQHLVYKQTLPASGHSVPNVAGPVSLQSYTLPQNRDPVSSSHRDGRTPSVEVRNQVSYRVLPSPAPQSPSGAIVIRSSSLSRPAHTFTQSHSALALGTTTGPSTTTISSPAPQGAYVTGQQGTSQQFGNLGYSQVSRQHSVVRVSRGEADAVQTQGYVSGGSADRRTRSSSFSQGRFGVSVYNPKTKKTITECTTVFRDEHEIPPEVIEQSGITSGGTASFFHKGPVHSEYAPAFGGLGFAGSATRPAVATTAYGGVGPSGHPLHSLESSVQLRASNHSSSAKYKPLVPPTYIVTQIEDGDQVEKHRAELLAFAGPQNCIIASEKEAQRFNSLQNN